MPQVQNELRLDANNGVVHFGALALSPQTTLDQLGPDFEVGAPRSVSVLGALVPCCFATRRFRDGELDFEVALRFEAGVLVRVFVSITDPSLPTETREQFYASREPLLARHRAWLNSQVGAPPSGSVIFEWGFATVGRNKSDDIFVSIGWSKTGA